MGGAAARTVINALEQPHHHHMYTTEKKFFLLSRALSIPNPTSKTDENHPVVASAAGGLVLAETWSLLHVGWASRVVV